MKTQLVTIQPNMDSIQIHSGNQFPVVPFTFRTEDQRLLQQLITELHDLIGPRKLHNVEFGKSQIQITSIREEELYLNESEVIEVILSTLSRFDQDITHYEVFNIKTRNQENILIIQLNYVMA